MGRGGVARQAGDIPHRQHAHAPAGAQGQGSDEITVAGVVAVAGQHGDLAGIRPLAAQGAPGGMGGAAHQFEAGRAGGDQARVEVAHLLGTVEIQGQIVVGSHRGSGRQDVSPWRRIKCRRAAYFEPLLAYGRADAGWVWQNYTHPRLRFPAFHARFDARL